MSIYGMNRGTGKLGLNGRIWALFATLILLLGLGMAAMGYRMVARVSNTGMQDKIDELSNIVKNEIVLMVHQSVEPVIDVLSHGMLQHAVNIEGRLALLPVLGALLDNYGLIGGFAVGYDNGDFFMVRSLRGEVESRVFGVPDGGVFIVTNISRTVEPAIAEVLFYDASLRLLLRRKSERARSFDPRGRKWFVKAMDANHTTVELPPSINFYDQPDMAFAKKSAGSRCVIATFIELHNIVGILRRELPTPNSHLALMNSAVNPLVSSHGAGEKRVAGMEDLSPVLRLAAKKYKEGRRGRGLKINDGERDWEVSLEEFAVNGAVRNIMLLAIPEEDLNASGKTFLLYSLFGLTAMLVLCTPLIWLAARRISGPLNLLAEKAGAMHKFLLADGSAWRSDVPEIRELARSMRFLRGNIRRMLTITRSINAERDFDSLLRLVLREIMLVVRADGGMLVLLDEERKIIPGKGGACWITYGERAARKFWEHGDLDKGVFSVLHKALRHDRIIHASVTRGNSEGEAGFLARGFADPAVSRIDGVCLPLHDRTGEQIGSLTLYKAVRPGRHGFHREEEGLVEAFSSMAAIALENQRLFKAQSDMRDAFMRILAGAIDAKSPHTGGHCQRVPVIFQMLLEEACAAQEGPFKDFSLDENGWEEARLAGWLHDCGKVTTPEYVMDKATKLETIHNRIHEIRTRFEVLKRDAEISCLRAIMTGADPEERRSALEAELAALDDDFAFVASCNLGGEYMDDEAGARLHSIGGRTWLRTLDKRLGASRAELERMGDVEPPPVKERLLMDNPEHIIRREEHDSMPEGNAWGFRLAPPGPLYNRGELYNLGVGRGTLTVEERYKINDHVTRTIMMLEGIPLPPHLRGMPEIAGSHHETMDGRGYPRGRAGEEMSWQARMLAVADIFEALTAADRPYKPRKTLREALDIMDALKERGHIDPEVYEMFVKSGIPRRYVDMMEA